MCVVEMKQKAHNILGRIAQPAGVVNVIVAAAATAAAAWLDPPFALFRCLTMRAGRVMLLPHSLD
jgi:hypothetical protein